MINDRLIDAGDLPLAVRDFGGDQPPLLLLHDAGANLAHMTTLARALRPSHRVITVDLRGHGRSGEGVWTWDAALGDLAAICVQMDLARPAVAGHGLGGMLAALWGQRHPEAPGVVSLSGNPPPGLLDTLEAGRVIPADQLPDVVERQQMAARDMGANEKVWIEGFRRNLVHENGETSTRPSAVTATQLRELMSELDLGPVYAATTCPELLVLPTRDLPEAHRRFVVDQAAAARHSRYISLADASHAMVIEQPAVLAQLITEFLRS